MSKRRPRDTPAKAAPPARAAETPRARGNGSAASEFELLKRLWNFNALLRDSHDVEKILASALKLSLDFFGATDGCIAVIRPGHEQPQIMLPMPAGSHWDRGLLADFLLGHKASPPGELMLSRIRRFDRMWGALAVRCRGAELRAETRKQFSSIGVAVTQLLERRDDERVREIRTRIDQKILDQIGPKDLFYQILHGIRSLIAYDHSAALLTLDRDRQTLEVVGEQIAWRKAKSQKVGLTIPLAKPIADLLDKNVVYGCDRQGKQWHDWTETEARALAELLDYNRADAAHSAEGTMLCAPLTTRHGVVGVLKVASVHPGAFGAYEAQIISQFLPQIAVALSNLRRTESLEQRMQAAERKQAMADLARAVSHDVNNAIGAVVPLVQQMQEDLKEGQVPLEVFRGDLEEVERAMQICRRIFGGMLSFSRGAARNSSEVYLGHEIENTLAIFTEGLERRGVTVEVNLADNLPPLVGIQADIDQLLLNLIGNARDAMESGGNLAIHAAKVEGRIELVISDTGRGIPPEQMAKIMEPFFTTKRTGNGLGLSICRSIVSQMRGRIHVDSTPGVGTTVRVSLPLPVEAQA